MKKLLLLSTLIAIMPFTANATDTIGPARVNSGAAVLATAYAPYAIATEEPGDTTNVVSASYVKGAYNDTIAAINRVNDDKQDRLSNENGEYVSSHIFSTAVFPEALDYIGADHDSDLELVSAAAVAAGIKSQRVTAVDSWGSTHTVDLGLKTVTQ